TIHGVGEARAAAIVKEFGAKTFEIIELDPARLSRIRGISIDTALKIGVEFAANAGNRNAMLYLQKMGLTANQAQKIIKEYKDKAIDIVKENPYILADEVYGIGFHTADGIAKNGGIAFDSPYRICSGIKYTLQQALLQGHVYLPKDILMADAGRLLGVQPENIEHNLLEMQMERELSQERAGDDVHIYLNAFHFAESYVARKLLELDATAPEIAEFSEEDIEEIQLQAGIVLADLQREAVRKAMSHGVLVITGGPGTGKTTTLNSIIKLLESKGLVIKLAAPTGRAAKRMSEATGRDGKTIHRLLGITSPASRGRIRLVPHGVDDAENTEDTVFEQAHVVIIDESSMVDIILMNKLLGAIANGIRLILVGDMNQLPSVGPGKVLKDIIQSGQIKTVSLDEVFRQSAASAIVMNAHRINSGQYPSLNENESDFYFVARDDAGVAVDTIVGLTTTRLPNFLQIEQPNIQILTPTRKGLIGTHNLNVALQAALNPPAQDKPEKNMGAFVYRVGDKVMQIKNNYSITWREEADDGALLNEGAGIFNGDEGLIIAIDNDARNMKIRFDDNRYVNYEYTQLDELMLAYAITIHKSQGSEYDVCIIPIMHGPPMLMTRNLLYTAVTRAKKMAVLVGTRSALFRMIDNDREVFRYSGLKTRLEKLSQTFENETILATGELDD
ncbi:MAG: ATP-dependent RecD-like DNA helicase, partial [Defluviitaleaceae bacterium]|nr:ATP-dependent RecD-like DNA helicase [Defluviitaleaceae bacterium]